MHGGELGVTVGKVAGRGAVENVGIRAGSAPRQDLSSCLDLSSQKSANMIQNVSSAIHCGLIAKPYDAVGCPA